MNIEYIESVICAEEKIKVQDLHARTRKREICEVRQMIMVLAMQFRATQYRAGGYYKLDHATAYHAKKKMNNLCDVYSSIWSKIRRYKNLLQVEEYIYPIEQ